MTDLNTVTNYHKGKFEHRDDLFNDIAAQLLNKELSDLTIIVNSKRFPSHKILLAARSEYFRALLYGNLKESQQSEIELKEISTEAFQLLLNYIYTSKINLTNLKVETIFDVFHIVHQYRFERLEIDLSCHLEEIVDNSNVLIILEKALLFQKLSLAEVCRKYIDEHVHEIFESTTFMDLPVPVLKKILRSDTLFMDELHIFFAVEKWSKHNQQMTADDFQIVLSLVRLPLISAKDLVNVVWPTKFYPDDIILEAIKTRSNAKCGELNFRAYSAIEENMASSKHGSEVKVDGRTLKLDGEETLNFDWISDATDIDQVKIVITFGKLCVVNCIKIFLRKYLAKANSFTMLQMSNDGNKWVSVIDIRKYTYQNYYMICFPGTVAKYCRLWCAESFHGFLSYIDFIQCAYSDNEY